MIKKELKLYEMILITTVEELKISNVFCDENMM